MKPRLIVILNCTAIILCACCSIVTGQTTSIFTYYGKVVLSDGMTPANGLKVIVENLTSGFSDSVFVGGKESGKYDVVCVDLYDHRAAAAGDMIRITMRDMSGALKSAPPVITLLPAHIIQQRVRLDLIEGIPGVQVLPPPTQVCPPGVSTPFNFRVKNTGNVNDTYDISVTNVHATWIESFPNAVGPIEPDSVETVQVVFSVPSWVTWPVTEAIALRACSRFNPQICDEQTSSGAIATMILASSVKHEDEHVVVIWRLSNEAQGLSYRLLRRTIDAPAYEEIEDPLVTQRDNEYTYRDFDIEAGVTYEYAIQLLGDKPYQYILGSITVPIGAHILYQNYPNPFNPSTTIRFNLCMKARVSLAIYDTAGRLVAKLIDNQMMPPRAHEIVWNAVNTTSTPVISGVYICRLTVDGTPQSRKIVCIR